MANDSTELPCADKMAFDTRDAAAATAAAADWQHGASLRPYKCKHCHLWHLTTKITE